MSGKLQLEIERRNTNKEKEVKMNKNHPRMQVSLPDFEDRAELTELDDVGNYRKVNLVLDWRKKTIRVETRDAGDNDITFYRHYGHEDALELPHDVDALALVEWVKEAICPLADELLALNTTRWKGNEEVATWTSNEAAYKLTSRLSDLCQDAPSYGRPPSNGKSHLRVYELMPSAQSYGLKWHAMQWVESARAWLDMPVFSTRTSEEMVQRLAGPNVEIEVVTWTPERAY